VADCWPDARSVSSASTVCVAAWSPWCRQVPEADGQQPSWARLRRRRSLDERWGAPDAGVHYSTSTCCHNMHIPVRDKYSSCALTVVTMKEKCHKFHSTIWTYCNLTKKVAVTPFSIWLNGLLFRSHPRLRHVCQADLLDSWRKHALPRQLHHTTPQFYSPFSRTTRVSRCQKRTSGLYGARED